MDPEFSRAYAALAESYVRGVIVEVLYETENIAPACYHESF